MTTGCDAAAIEPATIPAPIRPAPIAQPRPRASAWLGRASMAAIARADSAAANLVLVFMVVSRCSCGRMALLAIGRTGRGEGSKPGSDILEKGPARRGPGGASKSERRKGGADERRAGGWIVVTVTEG